MRFTLPVAFSLLAARAFADTLTATATVDRATLYDYGATVVRLVELAAPAGVHDLIIPGLPLDTDPATLRVAASEGVSIGTVSLLTDRLPVTEPLTTPEIDAAKAEIERLEEVVRQDDAAIAAILLRVDAANEQVSFLRSLGQGVDAGATNPDQLRALTQMVGDEVLAARQDGLAADLESQAAQRAREDDVEDLDEAQQTLAALQVDDTETAALSLRLETDGQPAQLEITTYVENAGWQPVYDLRLTTGDTPSLDIERGVLVGQGTGEDWFDVELTLSTARPMDRSDPYLLYPQLRRIVEERRDSLVSEMGGFAQDVVEAPVVVVEPQIGSANLSVVGRTVTYHYPNRVDLRDEFDLLRLRLDTLTVTPDVIALGVPRYDDTAFLVADMTNTSGEVILPGNALLYLDGALVNSSLVPFVPEGGTAKLGFGAIDGLQLTRIVPDRNEGERGFISSSNRSEETAILRVENLTSEAWDVRIMDSAPYSEQDDLEIAWSADPAPTIMDVDDRRGVLAWDFPIAAGETREIAIDLSMSWPSGFTLQ